MSHLPLPRTKARDRVPCLLGRTVQLLWPLLCAALATVGTRGLPEQDAASADTGQLTQLVPESASAPSAESAAAEGRWITPSTAPNPDADKAKTPGLQKKRKVTVADVERVVRKNDLDTLLQEHAVPQDWLRQGAGEGHRKRRKEKERRLSKKKGSKRAQGDSDVRGRRTSRDTGKSRRADGVKEAKREAKHERRKSREPTKERSKGKEKDRSKGKKEGKAKEKRVKEDKTKQRSKRRRTTVTPTKRVRKVSRRRVPPTPPTEVPSLPAAPPSPRESPAKEVKIESGVPPTPQKPPPPAEEKPKAEETLKPDRDQMKPGMPTIPTIAFVGKRVKKAPPSRLQQDLDALCTKHFRTLCRAQDGHGPFCQASTAVARLSTDETSVDGKGEWRCYEGSVAETDEMGMRCVDECGGQIRCAGKLRKKHVTSEPLTELSKFVDRRKWIYCSSFQYAANALCNFKKAGNVARYDPHRARWMCLDPVDIALESTGYCADNCGGTIACAGGVIPGETPARTVYIVHSDNIVEAFAALQPCKGPDEVCVATVLNPPKCVASGSPGAILKLSHQQAAMNKLCQREIDSLCRQGRWDKHCFEPWLARKDGTDLACYPREGLDFTELSRCFDGCNEAPCPGSPYSPGVPRVVPSGLIDIARNQFYCSPFQAAGNKYCSARRGPGYVARQHNVTREWQCFKNDELPAKGWTGCANNCGAFTTCASGSVDADPRLQEDHELEQTIRSTPAPCLTGEECEATPLNPPYCSQTRPNPQPVATSATELHKELGCVDAASDTTKTDSRPAAYGPFAQFSTLAWIRSKSEN